MAAFSSQNHHPFLVDASFLMEQPAVVPPSQFHPTQLLQETSFNGTSYHETISDSEPSFVTKNQSPETSMAVDKVEIGDQVTQKVTTMIKKRRNKIAPSFSCPQSSKDTAEGRKKKQKKNNGGVKEVEKKKEDNKGSEESPAGYIHVRARRGQATDSHSLAERVRREKISERMKMLQRLVPGCDKVTGKALVLDEIINYVQSLQYQVEFLSMKLASVNPMVYDLTGELDAHMIEPEHCGGMASALPTLPQCSPSQAKTFFDTTTVTTTASFPTGRANIDYLMVDSASFLQQEQQSNLFSEDSGYHNLFWDMEEQRQKFLSPYGFSNDLCSLD